MLNARDIVSTLRRRSATTFAALRHRNYRTWFFGQTVSLMGTWMQSVAQGWLVYELTRSDLALGTISFAGSIPTLFLMIPAGALIDRLPKKKILLVTQTVMMLQAFVMAALAITHLLQVWHIALLAACLGIAQSFDAPTRQALTVEMVDDRRDLTSAIAMNSMMFNLARIVGPSIGGVLLALLGPAWCFSLNGISFLAVLGAILAMRFPVTTAKAQGEPLTRQIGTGLRYIRKNSLVLTIILLVGVANLFGFFYGILLPAFAADVLQVGKTGLGILQTAVGMGAITGSLAVASQGRSRYGGILMTVGSILFPLAAISFAWARSFPLALGCIALVGFGFVTQNASSNTLIQSIVPDELRGRVMGVYTLMFFGTTPFCALMAGSLAQAIDPTWAVTIGSSTTLLFALTLAIAVPALRRAERPEVAATPARPVARLQTDAEEVEG